MSRIEDQTFRTLLALEKMANAVTNYLTADKRPPEVTDFKCVFCPSPSTTRDEAGHSVCATHTDSQDQTVTGSLTVKGDLVVEGCSASVESQTEPDALDNLGRVVAKHHQALALVSTFAMMKDKPPLGPEPAREIARLLGMAACGNCVGTRTDRDEPCGVCNGSGFIKA